MVFLVATAKALNANSYVTILRADAILGSRLYAGAWFDATTTPDAENYVVNGDTGIDVGNTTLPIDGGAGTFTTKSFFTIQGDTTLYKVTEKLTAPGILKFTPGLVVKPPDGTPLQRETLNEKEQAVTWATTIFDNQMIWFGTRRERRTDPNPGQRLRWPRSGVRDEDGDHYDFDTIPELLEIATAEMGLVLIQKDRFKRPDALGLGVVEVELGDGALKAKIDRDQIENVIPQNILSLLSPLGYLEGEAQHGTAVLPVVRS